jgi:hypothetical protein
MKYNDINAARFAHAGAVIIWYPFLLGGSIKDRYWMAEKNGEVLDYNSKASLLADYPDAVVLTLHRCGGVSATPT